MKLPQLAIGNYRFTEAMVGLLAILGAYSFLTMPRSEDPMFDTPFISVIIAFPGADPEVVETLAGLGLRLYRTAAGHRLPGIDK